MNSPFPSPVRGVLFFGLLAGLLLAGQALGHQPFESGTVARLQHGRLEVTTTMSEEIATRLSGGRGDGEGANFEEYQARLQERAAGLFQVFAGDELLVPQRAIVRRNAHGDAECVLIFAEPKQ